MGGGKFANGARTGAFRYLFNEWQPHGSGMAKNKDGHWQMRDNAANDAAGLRVSTSTHSCDDGGIRMCTLTATFLGSGDNNVSNTIDTINQGTDFIDKVSDGFDKYVKHPVYKTGSYFLDWNSRWDVNKQNCIETCGKERWQLKDYGSYK